MASPTTLRRDTEISHDEPPSVEVVPRSRGRVVAARFVGGLACLWGTLTALAGVGLLLVADGNDDVITSGVAALVFAAAAFVVAVGAFRAKRWAWVVFMTWAACTLALNLLRIFFFDEPPHYPLLAISTVTVFLLTPLDVQIAFGIRSPRIVGHDTSNGSAADRV